MMANGAEDRGNRRHGGRDHVRLRQVAQSPGAELGLRQFLAQPPLFAPEAHDHGTITPLGERCEREVYDRYRYRPRSSPMQPSPK